MGLKYRIYLFLKLQINEVDEHGNYEGKKGENGVRGSGHEILLWEVDSQNVESSVVNRHGCSLDTQFRSVEKKINKQ